MVALLQRNRDVNRAEAVSATDGDSMTSSIAGLTAPLLIALPLRSNERSMFGLQRYSLLFRDETTAESWRELATELRMQRDNHPEQKNFAIWRTALAKQLGL
ncbi:MAG: hypothetical protein JNL19_06480 [Burkholderiales bacterium]|nr:hypothetical protein [Burkholderiales bacterium]MBL8687415.1 hypothetical protein [Alphaproteobacteria bacterium]